MTMLRELREEREVRHDRATAAKAQLRLVLPNEGARGHRTTRVLTMLVAAAACAVLFGTVCTHVLLTQGQADLDVLETRASDAEAAHQQLQVQVAELESPARIVPAARERLGMIPPSTVVYLTPGLSGRERGPGAPRAAAPTTPTPTTPTATTTPTRTPTPTSHP